MAEFCEAPTLVVVETQSLPLKTDLQHTILFAEKRDRVLVFHAVAKRTAPRRRTGTVHGPKSTSEVVDRRWDTTAEGTTALTH